jgi:hypothetical protein
METSKYPSFSGQKQYPPTTHTPTHSSPPNKDAKKSGSSGARTHDRWLIRPMRYQLRHKTDMRVIAIFNNIYRVGGGVVKGEG